MKSTLALPGWAFIAGLFLLPGCNSPSGSSAEEQLTEIAALEDSLRSKSSMDTALGNELLKQYTSFREKYPQRDSLGAVFLLKKGRIYSALQGQEGYKQALAAYESLLKEYPDHSVAPEALLNKAIIHERRHNGAEARDSYQRFLELYPEHAMTSDVERLMEMVSLSRAEQQAQVQEWINKSSNDSPSDQP